MPGFQIVLRKLRELVKDAEQETFKCEDPSKLVLLAQQARGAGELLRKFEIAVQTAQISETAGSDWPSQESE